MNHLILLAEQAEDYVNVTPVLLRFIGKFFLIFTAVAVITVLTPRMAKQVDKFREKHSKAEVPEDPRCKAVRGPYDMPAPKKPKTEEKKEASPDEK